MSENNIIRMVICSINISYFKNNFLVKCTNSDLLVMQISLHYGIFIARP